jgi:hypothetical protein
MMNWHEYLKLRTITEVMIYIVTLKHKINVRYQFCDHLDGDISS